MLGGLNPLVQRLGSISWQHRHGLLSDYWPGVHACVYEVNGATGDLYSIIQSLLPGLQPWKCREQGRMNIDDTSFESAQELAFQNPHETGEHDQVDTSLLKGGHISPFGGIIHFRAKFAGINVMRVKPELLCPG